MTALNIVIVVVAVLVLITCIWTMRSARNAPPQPSSRNDLQRRREQRDLL